jgi:hypothetical protein
MACKNMLVYARCLYSELLVGLLRALQSVLDGKCDRSAINLVSDVGNPKLSLFIFGVKLVH